MLGAGYWGQKLIRSLLEVPGVERVYCVEPRPEVRLGLEHRFGSIDVLDRADDLLENPKVRAAVVATPARSHHRLARQWLLAGKHVLVEKPVALDMDAAQELTTLAASSGLALLPGHTYCFNGAEEYLRGFLQAGELGELQWLQSERMNLGRFRPDVSVLWDLAPHDASMLVDLFHPTIETYGAIGAVPAAAGMDSCSVLLGTSSRAGVAWTLSWRSPVKVRRVMMIGTRRTVLWDDLDSTWPLAIYRTELRKGTGPGGSEEIVATVGDPTLPAVDHGEPLRKECQHFIDVVHGLADPLMDAAHILRVTDMVVRADAALATS